MKFNGTFRSTNRKYSIFVLWISEWVIENPEKITQIAEKSRFGSIFLIFGKGRISVKNPQMFSEAKVSLDLKIFFRGQLNHSGS